MDYGQIDDIRGHLEILKNEDIMIQFEGVNMLKSHLAISNQDSLGEFPLEDYSRRLIEMLGMPNNMGMDILIDIKFAAMQCLYSLIDIYPQNTNNMVAKGFITSMCSAMEEMMQMGDFTIVEQCIKTFDKVSYENPHAILKSKAIPMSLQSIDFFDSRTQDRILNFISNCCGVAQSESEFDEHLLDLIPQLCPMLEIYSENHVIRAQKISTILHRMVRSFTAFYQSSAHFDKIAGLYRKFSDRGAINCITDGIKRYVQVIQEQRLLGDSAENSMEVDMINTQAVSGQSKQYNDETLCNFFKILTFGCKYQITTIQTIVNDETINMIEAMLPGEDQEQPGYVLDMTSLINQLFPANDDLKHDRNQVFIFAPGQNYQYSEQPDSQYQMIKKAALDMETKKKGIFGNLKREFFTLCASKILPKLFQGYRKNINIQYRINCLSIIDKILAICPDDVVQNQIEALPLAQFVLQIFQNGRAQQVLLCLRMITRVLQSNSMKFALPFLREGVKQAVFELTDIQRLFKYEKEAPLPYEQPPTLCPCGKPGCTYGQPPGQQNLFGDGFNYQSSYVKTLFNNKDEKTRVKQKVEQLEAILKQESIKIPESERANIQKVLKQHVDTLKLLEEKELFEKFMEAKMKKKHEREEEKKEEQKQENNQQQKKPDAEGNAEVPELKKKKSEVPKITELIMNEATQLQKQYFQNDIFLNQMANTYETEMKLMARFKNLADALTDAACSTQFDCEITQNLMIEFTDIITGQMGITSFEFQTSGLLQALEVFLTKSPSQADFEQEMKIQNANELAPKNSEELKLSQAQKKAFQDISQEDAKCLILRLKVFAHALCHVKANKLPFKELISQCHEILSKKEDIIFDETSSERPQSSVEAIRQLNKNVVINLVFDGDMKQITKSIEETELLALEQNLIQSEDKEMKDEEEDFTLEEPKMALKSKSLALPFAKLGQDNQEEKEKSQVFAKRYDLFNQLKQVPLNIQQSDNIWLLEDFLLKRIKTSEDVRKLVMHTRPGERAGLFGGQSEQAKEQQLTEFEDIDNPELQELHRRCVDRIGELLDEAETQSKFEELKPELIEELTQEISLTVIDTEVTDPQLKLFFSALFYLTEAMIKDHQMSLGEGEDSLEDLNHEQTQQHIVELIIMKKHSFFGMIETLQQRTKDQITVLKADMQNNQAEESKEPKLEQQEESKEQKPAEEPKMEIDEADQKTKLKVQEPVLPVSPGDSPVLSMNASSEKGEEISKSNEKPQDSQIAKKNEIPQTKEQPDVEMKEENPSQKSEQVKTESKPEEKQEEKPESKSKENASLQPLPEILSEEQKREQEKAKLLAKMNEQVAAKEKLEKIKQEKYLLAQTQQKMASALYDHKETTSGNNILEGELEELIRQNNGEDIEIEFYCLGKKIELNTSVFELVQQNRERASKQNQRLISGQVPSKQKKKKEQEEVDPKNPNSILQSLMASFSKKDEEIQRFGFPSSALTIYFTIKDKVHVPRSARKDSLVEFTQKRERTMSQHVETISAKSLNHIVQQLIETEFAVFKDYVPKPKAQKSNTEEESTKKEIAQREALKAKQEDVDRRLVEQSLKILKVLHYLYTNIHLFSTDGINYLLMKYKSGDELDLLKFNDTEMNLAIQSDIEESLFHHTKLDANMLKQIQDPYKLVSSGLSDILKQIFSSCAFLFPYETKMLYFKLVSFIGVDINRSLYFLKNHMEIKRKSGKGLAAAQFQLMFGVEKEEKSRIGHQKVKVERQRLIDSGLLIIDKLQKRSLLEIEYKDEVGHGLGPTLEFYTSIAQAITKENGGALWRKDVKDNCLFPAPIDIRKLNPEEIKRIGELFRMAGTFVAKSIVDDRLIELPISPLMWKILLGKKTNMFDLKYLEKDPIIFKSISLMQRAANRKKEVEDQNLDSESTKARLERIKEEENGIYNVETMCIGFWLPGTGEMDESGNVKVPPIELIQDGANTDVTLENVQEYIDLVLQAIFHDTVNLQIQSFKKGFNSVLPIESLRVFQVDEEIEMLVCGKEPDDAQWNQWTDQNLLRELIKPNHGYSSSSRCYSDFLRYINQLKKGEREKFILWTTGSRRLRLGGFETLDPPMSLYRNTVSHTFLPSVNTCLHYVKMPEYDSFDILKQKFDQATQEGSNYFAFD